VSLRVSLRVAAPCWSRRFERSGFEIHLLWFRCSRSPTVRSPALRPQRNPPGVPTDRSSSVGWRAGVPTDRSSSVGWRAPIALPRHNPAFAQVNHFRTSSFASALINSGPGFSSKSSTPKKRGDVPRQKSPSSRSPHRNPGIRLPGARFNTRRFGANKSTRKQCRAFCTSCSSRQVKVALSVLCRLDRDHHWTC
jgi:hypothetical protein